MALYYNVIGSTAVTTELISPSSIVEVSAITVCNVHASNDATVTIFIQNDPESGTTNTYNILKSVAVPAKTTLLLDNDDIFIYDNEYGLYITVGSSDTVDVAVF
jgi:hypothetical protein